MKIVTPLIGMQLYGYCNGYFGRDSYNDKRIEVVASDYIVARDDCNNVELLNTTEWDGKIPIDITLKDEEYE